MEWKFKRTFFGNQVLMIQDKHIGSYTGSWIYYWRKATQDDVIEFMVEIELIKEKSKMISKLKDSNPELFI